MRAEAGYDGGLATVSHDVRGPNTFRTGTHGHLRVRKWLRGFLN